MPDQQPRYLPQVIDFLGFLEAKLRDLQGVSTLVYELIQNADDVKDAAGIRAQVRLCLTFVMTHWS